MATSLPRVTGAAWLSLICAAMFFSLARWTGVKTKDVTAKLGRDPVLPSIDQVFSQQRFALIRQLQTLSDSHRKDHREQLVPLVAQQLKMTTAHRSERERLSKAQEDRWAVETAQRTARFRRGLGAVLDLLTGRLSATRRENEREAYRAFLRDREQRQRLFDQQLKERRALELSIRAIQREYRETRARAARGIMATWRSIRIPEFRTRDFGLELER